jgi:hypothetical protein
MTDVKTLRLASIELTSALLARFVRYQRELLAALARAPHAEWAGRYAFAHGRALAESGLDVLQLHRLKGPVAEYAGRRTTFLAISQRLAEAEERAAAAAQAGRPVPQAEAALLARAQAELPALADWADFEARYGPEALTCLRKEDVELTLLHRELARVEGVGGHLHLATAQQAG